jgi:hypothetical protein
LNPKDKTDLSILDIGDFDKTEIEMSSLNTSSFINRVLIQLFSNLLTILIVTLIVILLMGNSLLGPIKEKLYMLKNSPELQKAALIMITDSPAFYLELSKFFEGRKSYERSRMCAEIGLELIAGNTEIKVKLLNQITNISPQ